MAETRKLAAILAADVAGYSKLAGSDEERTGLNERTDSGSAAAVTALSDGHYAAPCRTDRLVCFGIHLNDIDREIANQHLFEIISTVVPFGSDI